MKSQIIMIGILAAASGLQHYRKSGVFGYEICTEEQKVDTIHGEKLEVSNTAMPGDIILTDSLGGRFVIAKKIFDKRYEVLTENTARAKGECWAIPWTEEECIFEAPAAWNDPSGMLIQPGDMLASPDATFSEAYRIKKEEFKNTYALVSATAIEDHMNPIH